MFTVVIPVYNHGSYLAEAVLSAARPELVTEILIADDGSRDDSPHWIRGLSGLSPKVKDVTPPGDPNEGAHAKLNNLVKVARNQWIAVLNSDDVFLPGRFEQIARELRARPFDLAFGNVTIIDRAGSRIGLKRGPLTPQYPFPKSFDVPAMMAAGQWKALLGNQNFLATTSNMVFHRDLFERVGGFAPYRYVHDWDFALRAAELGVIRYIPHFLGAYRIHSSNTIQEDPEGVNEEVKAMFAGVRASFPSMFDGAAGQAALEGNQYLQARVRAPLAVVLPDGPAAAGYEKEIRAAVARVQFPRTIDAAADAEYVYAPSSVEHALLPEHLQNAVLACSVQDCDFLLVSASLAEGRNVSVGQLADHLVARGPHLGAILAGATPSSPLRGLVARMPFGKIEPRDIGSVFGAIPVSAAGPVIGLGGPAAPIPARAPAWRNALLPRRRDPGKPLVFVLPAFFAVGGVERQVVDMMRQLRDRYDFVVVCNERLREQQGSLRAAAGDLALAFYELAEIAPKERFLDMLARLRDTYRPNLLWIANGSPWLCDEAASIRALFRDAAIADQRCYDNVHGWITRVHEPGIRAADRFIAVNERIRAVFTGRVGIPESKIDLIYSPIDASILGDAVRDEATRAACAAKLGLPLGRRLVGWVGRLTQQKRPLDFLEMVRRLRNEGDETLFVMAGDGELAGACEKFIEEHSLDNVRRIRYCDPLWELYCLLSGFVLTSEYEGLPIAMLQAIAMGLPVAATDTGDIALVINRYRAGAVIPDINDLETSLRVYRQWRDSLDTWRANALEAAPRIREEFSAEATAARYDECFRAAMNPARAREAAA